MLSLSQNLKIK